MLVSQILKTKGDAVFTVEPGASLQAAAALLGARGVGAMVVTGPGGRWRGSSPSATWRG